MPERNLFYEQLEQQSESTRDFVKRMIDDVMKSRNRSVAIYFHPENGMSINVFPWPDGEDLYQMYKDGKITFNDFRTKIGLPPMKETDLKGEDDNV